MPRFLDTNILLLYLTADDETKARACFELLRRVERGEEVVVTSDLVIADVVFNLERQYGVSRDDIRRLVEPIVALRGLRLPRKALFATAFDLYCDSRVDFVDAYNAAYMESRGIDEVYSYDTDFDRIAGISRFEPSAVP